jgi:hypothetical protein
MSSLTEPELAYLDRFCYEVDHFLHGEGSIFQQCLGQYQNLGALTNFAPLDIKTRWEHRDRPAPPIVPFPWRSLDGIPARLVELKSQPRGKGSTSV